MPRLDDAQLERLRTMTVELVLEIRAAYLRAGGSPLKHWDQLQSRMRSATARAANPDEWETMMGRGLQLGAPSKGRCRALLDLGSTVRELGAQREWLRMMDREAGLILAMTRAASEQRRAEVVNEETGEVFG